MQNTTNKLFSEPQNILGMKAKNTSTGIKAQNRASLFTSIQQSKTPKKAVEIRILLAAIKSGVLFGDNIGETVLKARTAGKGSELYSQIKKALPAITWGSMVKGSRNMVSNREETGFMYFDVDNVAEDKLPVIKRVLASMENVYAVWYSLSGKGLGGLISVNKATKAHYLIFAELCEQLNIEVVDNVQGIQLDKSVKDTTTRLNVISFDPEIIINDKAKELYLSDEEVSLQLSVAKKNKLNNKHRIPKSVAIEDTTVSVNNPVDVFNKVYDIVSKDYTYEVGQRCGFITKFSGLMLSFGVSMTDAAALATEKHTDWDTERMIDIYERYSDQFNTLPFGSNYTVKYHTPNAYMDQNQYLSDVIKIEDVLGKILIAPTGAGKTNFISSNVTKGIVLVPTISLALECANKYNGTAYIGSERKVSNVKNVIYCTYHSFKNLAETTIIDISDYNIFLDEAHNFVTSSNRGYMFNVLDDVLDILRDRSYKSLTLMTATPIESNIDLFNDMETFVVARKNSVNKQLTVVKAADKYATITEIVAATKKQNGITMIHLNNKGSKLEKLQAALEGYKVFTANADEKDSEHFVNAIHSSEIDANVIIATDVLAAGNSFYVNNNDVVRVVFFNTIHPSLMYQFASRIRNAKKLEVIILKSGDFQNDTNAFFRYEQAYDTIHEFAEANQKCIIAYQNISNQKQVEMLNTISNSNTESYLSVKYTKERMKTSISDLLIINEVFNREARMLARNMDELASVMSTYGFTYNGIKNSYTEFTKEYNDRLQETVKMSKEAKKEKELQILELVLTQGLDVNEEIVKKVNSIKDPIEKDVRVKLNAFYKYEKDSTKVRELFIEFGQTTQAYNLFHKQVKYAIAIASGLFVNDKEVLLTQKIVRSLPKQFDTETALNIINKEFGAAGKLTQMTKANVIHYLRVFVDLKEKVTTINGKKVRVYVVTGETPCKVNINEVVQEKSLIEILKDVVTDFSKTVRNVISDIDNSIALDPNFVCPF